MPKMVDDQGEVVLGVVMSGISETSGCVSSNSLSRHGCVVIDSIQRLRLNLAGLGINHRGMG